MAWGVSRSSRARRRPLAEAACVGDLHQPPQVGVQQVRVVGEQVIDQPGSLRVAGQGAQQVAGGALPLAQLAERHERSRQRPLIIRPRGDIGPGVQQGVVERLVEQPVHRPGSPAAKIGRAAAPGFHEEVGRRGPGEPGQVVGADTRPVDGFHRQLPQRGGQARCLGEGQRGERVGCRKPGDRAEPLQVGGQRRVHRGSELQAGPGRRPAHRAGRGTGRSGRR